MSEYKKKMDTDKAFALADELLHDPNVSVVRKDLVETLLAAYHEQIKKIEQMRHEIELFLPDKNSGYESGISDALTIIDKVLEDKENES